MEESDSLGKLIITGKPNRLTMARNMFFIVVILIIGVILMLMPAIGTGNAKYYIEERGHVFYFTGIFLFVFGVILAGIMQALIPKEKYYVYEEGIVTRKGQRKIELKYEEIEDIYVFVYRYSNFIETINTIAFRKDESDEWKIINPRFGKASTIIAKIMELHTKKRTKHLRKSLKHGQAIKFKYIDAKKYIAKSVFSRDIRDILEMKVNEIIIKNGEITTETEAIALKNIYSENSASKMGYFKLKDKASKETLFEMQYTSIYSPEVFKSILEILLKDKR